MRSSGCSVSAFPAIPGLVKTRYAGILLLALLTQGCTEDPPPVRQVHTSFSETAGLVVTDDQGRSQQLIAESLAVRAVVSPSGRWIAVEDSKLSNLVVVRLFRHSDGRYEETPLPDIRENWRRLAHEAGLELEELINPRVGIEGFGPDEETLQLQFSADTGLFEQPELIAMVEIALEPQPESQFQ